MEHKKITTAVFTALAIASLPLATSPARAGVGVDASALIEAVTLEGVRTHLEAFQAIADANGGVREASSDGYIDSAMYVSDLMTRAGYNVSVQLFPYTFFEDVTDPALEQISPEAVTYVPYELDGFGTMTYSGSGDVTAAAQAVDVQLPPAAEPNSSTSGCEADDFADFVAGNVAIVQRGNCSFADKAINAENAGATGVVIFNEGQEGRTEAFGGTLGGPGVTIPVVAAAFAIGEALVADGAQVRLAVDAVTETRLSANVIADTPGGRENRTVVVGGHLDSVPEGPGINDNGSGSAAILETALQMAELGLLGNPDEGGIRNRIRFAWWGAEEAGLLGSTYYVSALREQDLLDIVANLNFDMVGSPNYARFVYDGDGSDTEVAGPEGSAFIEWLYRDYFEERGLSSSPTEFSGRSDYGPFIELGIPAGGLFTGAEGIKTEEEVGLYGGTAGEAYDACYHLECDTIENVNDQGLMEMTGAIAYSSLVFGLNELPAASAAKRKVDRVNTSALDYRGNHLQR